MDHLAIFLATDPFLPNRFPEILPIHEALPNLLTDLVVEHVLRNTPHRGFDLTNDQAFGDEALKRFSHDGVLFFPEQLRPAQINLLERPDPFLARIPNVPEGEDRFV